MHVLMLARSRAKLTWGEKTREDEIDKRDDKDERDERNENDEKAHRGDSDETI